MSLAYLLENLYLSYLGQMFFFILLLALYFLIKKFTCAYFKFLSILFSLENYRIQDYDILIHCIYFGPLELWKVIVFLHNPLEYPEGRITLHNAAAAAKSLQSCQTLCDPTDGSPPGSPVPGILQARTLEWVAISFSK